MRISDWSSDVCSSDLSCPSLSQCPLAPPVPRRSGQGRAASDVPRALWDRLEGLPCWRRPPWRFYPAGGSPLWAESSLPHSAHEPGFPDRSEEHTSELQSLMRISYAVFCLKKNNKIP